MSLFVRLRALCLLFLCAGLTACIVPTPKLTDGAVSPGAGHAGKTQFTFSVVLRGNDATAPELLENRAVFLALYSPDIDNQWAWREIPMTDDGDGRYSLRTVLAEHSTAYRYRFGVRDKEAVVYSPEMPGPQLTIDVGDRQPPRVSRSVPEHLAVGVDPQQRLQLTFDEVVDPQSLAEATVSVVEPASDRRSAALTGYQNRLLIEWAQPFDQSVAPSLQASRYTVKVEGVKDLNGNVMEPYTFSFHIASPQFQTFRLESRKYAGHCLTVRDVKKRFASPAAWNPEVEIEPCLSSDPDGNQRWLLTQELAANRPMQIRWAQNYDYCLHKNNLSDPAIRRCAENEPAQRFNASANGNAWRLESAAGGCVAVGIVDAGGKNRVVSSLCLDLARNDWIVHAAELQALSPAFYLGKYNVSVADIRYANPPANVNLSTAETRELVKYLYRTEAINAREIYEELQLTPGSVVGAGFVTANPYYPSHTGNDIPAPKVKTVQRNGVAVENPEGYADPREGWRTADDGQRVFYQQKVASQWFSDMTHGKAAAARVCAVKFADGDRVRYTLKTFDTRDAAVQAGWIVTHQGHCGTCSTLKDLAVYIGTPDLTTPTRLCTKRGQGQQGKLDDVAQCIAEAVGFTPMCAETWAYNGQHTSTECQSTCLATYGNDALLSPTLNGIFKMVLFEKFDACPAEVESGDPAFRAEMQADGCPLANENTGKLNACLWCDERYSGPGFKYVAARTRRSSGLKSSIPRPNDTLYYEADHTLYFR